MSPTMSTARKVWVLAAAGGLAFWTANWAVSLTPVAAEYRAALSIAYVPMLAAALLGGLVVGGCVSYALVRFDHRIPARHPVAKSLLLSLVALVVATLTLQGPSSYQAPAGAAWRTFFLGALFNVVRILALGLAIGLLYKRLEREARS